MKKKYIAVLLAAAMIACSGCSLNLNLGGGETVDDGGDKDDDNDGQSNNVGQTNNGSEENNGGSTGNDGDDNGGTVADEYTVFEGPEYVVAYFEDQYGGYGEDDGAKLIVHADRLIIVNPNYPKLTDAVNYINAVTYENTIMSWDYSRYIDFGGLDVYSRGMNWDEEALFNVSRNDSQVFTINQEYYSYLGGAHPYNSRSSYNIDTMTGDVLELKDVVTDYEKVYEYLMDYLVVLNEGNATDIEYPNEYKDCLYYGWEEIVDNAFHGEECTVNWAATEDSIVIYFNGYDIAPWASGEIDVEIRMSEHPELFKEEYFHEAGKVGKRPVSVDIHYTDVMDGMMKELEANMGVWNYDDCVAFVAGKTDDYSCHEPYESEDCGEVRLTDKETGCTMRLDFSPLDYNANVYSKETDALSGIYYYSDNASWLIYTQYDTKEVKYAYTDYYNYTRMMFRTAEDFWLYLGTSF